MKNYSLKWVFITSRQIIQEHVVIHGIGNVVPVASSGTFGATWELEGGVDLSWLDLTWQSDHAVMQLSTYKRICLYMWMLYQQHFWVDLTWLDMQFSTYTLKCGCYTSSTFELTWVDLTWQSDHAVITTEMQLHVDVIPAALLEPPESWRGEPPSSLLSHSWAADLTKLYIDIFSILGEYFFTQNIAWPRPERWSIFQGDGMAMAVFL